MAPAPTAEPHLAAPAMLPSPYRVTGRRQDTHDTWTLALQPEEQPLAPFAPGQFAMLYVLGVGEVPISVSADLTTTPGSLQHTVRAVGSVTEAICRAEPGDGIGVRGPFGSAWPLEDAAGRDVVVVAGGIGLAPLRPVLWELLAHRNRYGTATLLYGARSPADLLYVGEVEGWRAGGIDVAVTVDAAPGGWDGRVGVVTTLVDGARLDPAHATAFICGPEIMMRFTVAALLERGVRASDVWVSMERSMQCGVGHCGHCQLGPTFVCKDGPVYRWDAIAPWVQVREL